MVRISKNTKIQIFYDRKYMAFDLFIYSVNNVLKTLFNDVCFIDNFDKLEKNSTTVLIMYINDLGKYAEVNSIITEILCANGTCPIF
jgi:hypothetical protein